MTMVDDAIFGPARSTSTGYRVDAVRQVPAAGGVPAARSSCAISSSRRRAAYYLVGETLPAAIDAVLIATTSAPTS